MIKKSMKLEGLLDEAELAALLESLGLLARADADELLAPEGLKALKLSVRKRYGQIYTTLKIERDAQAPAPGDAAGAAEATPPGVCAAPEPRPVKYSALKKRLRESFRAVTVNLAQDRLPPEEAVEDFLADSARVTCYPGYGDEFYADYARVHEAFAAAWAGRDLAAMQAAVRALKDCKRRCHARYA